MASGGSNSSIDTDILSDETFDLLCTVCKRKGRNSEAEKYCVECQDYYCLICVNVHEDVPSLNGHKILDKGSFPSGSVKSYASAHSASHKAPTERCDRHTHHYIDMYCKNHDDVGCGTCIAIDHRLCKDIFYIPEFLQNNTCTTTIREIQQKLDSVAKALKEQQENFKLERERLLKSKTATLESIKKFRKEINDRLDELETNTISDIEDKYKTFINEMEESIRILERSKVSLKSARDKLKLASGNKLQNFVNVKKGENIAENAAKSIKVNQLQTFKDVDFTGDHRLASLLHEIKVFGKIEQRIAMKAENIATVNIHKNDSLLHVKGSTKYSVKVQSDKNRCDIISACTLEDGTIILSDYNNSKLKRLDSSSCTVIDYCDLQGRPCQVCSIDKQQAAVCLHDKKEVQFISLSSKLTLTNKIKTGFACYGLAYADGNLYISDKETSVYIYSVSGRKLKQFSKDQSGQKLFSSIRSLAFSEDGSKICVTDRYKGLIILDNNGRVVGRFDDSQLRVAHDCCLTGSGSLLVCGNYSNNVLQFGLNGNLIGEVVKFDDTSADHQAICCNQQMSKMIIGRYSNAIEVYDLI